MGQLIKNTFYAALTIAIGLSLSSEAQEIKFLSGGSPAETHRVEDFQFSRQNINRIRSVETYYGQAIPVQQVSGGRVEMVRRLLGDRTIHTIDGQGYRSGDIAFIHTGSSAEESSPRGRSPHERAPHE